MNYRRIAKCLAMLVAATVLPLSPSVTHAYKTSVKWGNPQSTYGIYYSLDDNLDNLLRNRDGGGNSPVPGAYNLIAYNAAPQWNNTRFSFTRTAPFSNSGNYISVKDFSVDRTLGTCGTFPSFVYPDSAPAWTCVHPTAPGSPNMDVTQMFFNVSSTYSWNTSGVLDKSSYPRKVDVLTVGLHELGHMIGIEHDCDNHGEAVMCPDYTLKQTPRQDDQNGVTQEYGVRTSWESGYATGEINTVAYAQAVSGYGISYPELGPRPAEFGATPYGSTMELLAGNALTSYSYAYMRLFTESNDAPGSMRNYLIIKPGMKLKWVQYNYQQRTMSVDFRMTDGSALRDNSCVRYTEEGLSVHPAGRANAPARQWFYNTIDLSCLAGKTIDQWMIAYDNGQSGWAYIFRAYFDNVRIEY